MFGCVIVAAAKKARKQASTAAAAATNRKMSEMATNGEEEKSRLAASALRGCFVSGRSRYRLYIQYSTLHLLDMMPQVGMRWLPVWSAARRTRCLKVNEPL